MHWRVLINQHSVMSELLFVLLLSGSMLGLRLRLGIRFGLG